MTTKHYFINILKKIEKILSIGIRNEESELIRYAKLLTNILTVLTVIIGFVFLVKYFWNPQRDSSLLSIALVLGCILVISRYILNNIFNYIHGLQSELNHANEYIEKIKKQNARLEMFNTLAAHDLRTPTRQVLSFVSLAKNSENEQEIEEYLNMTTKAGHRMNELIEAIAMLKTIGSQTQHPIDSIDLADIISKIELLEIKPQYGNINIYYKGLPSIKFRPAHLQLVLSNLLSNAAKFNQNIEKVIRIKSRRDAKHLYLSFIDNGIGIEDKFKVLVFQPFKKLHLNEEYSGAGLGLYIVAEILNFYDGSISLSNNEFGGSTFTIKLPLALVSSN